MNVCSTDHPDVLLLDPERYGDRRGYLFEAWQAERYAEAGLPEAFAQDNVSRSKEGVLRGLHYQHPQPQGKLITVLSGRIWDVAVDIRRRSDTFGEWAAETLSEANGRQLYVPEGFAHGFAVLDGPAIVHYKCTGYYAPDCEHTIRWDDPQLQIDWPVDGPILSSSDREAPPLGELPETAFPEV